MGFRTYQRELRSLRLMRFRSQSLSLPCRRVCRSIMFEALLAKKRRHDDSYHLMFLLHFSLYPLSKMHPQPPCNCLPPSNRDTRGRSPDNLSRGRVPAPDSNRTFSTSRIAAGHRKGLGAFSPAHRYLLVSGALKQPELCAPPKRFWVPGFV